MSNMAAKAQVSPSPKRSASPIFKIWIAFLFVTFAIGGYFIVDRLITGLVTTNLSSFTPWGAWIAFYIFFVGLSAGSFLLSSLIFVFGMEQYEKVGKAALFTAIISMIVALTFVLMDLGRPDRVLNALAYWNVTSVLAWEMRFYILYITLLCAELYIAMREDLIHLAKTDTLKGKVARLITFKNATIDSYTKQRDQKWLKTLGIIGIPLAIIGVHGGTGALFAVVSARAGWNSAIFPIIFVVSAMVSGTALLVAMYVIKRKAQKKMVDLELVQSLAKLMVAFLIIDLGLQFFDYLVAWYSLDYGNINTLITMFTSEYSWSFWGVQMFLGAVVPIFIVFHKKLGQSVNALLVASILIVIGIIGVRFNIVVPSLIVPLFPELPWGYYFPTLKEWLVSVGIVSMGLLIYTFGETLLPIDGEENFANEVDSNAK